MAVEEGRCETRWTQSKDIKGVMIESQLKGA
jgi:3-deoxy-D-arabino-heptulosonate 7-phosphate (DAHP) synthase